MRRNVPRLPWKLSIQPPRRGEKPPLSSRTQGVTVLKQRSWLRDPNQLRNRSVFPSLLDHQEKQNKAKLRTEMVVAKDQNIDGWNQPEQINPHLKGASCARNTSSWPRTQAKKTGIAKVSALVDFSVQTQFLLARPVLFPLTCTLPGCLQSIAFSWSPPSQQR